jgi:hypothetical protein
MCLAAPCPVMTFRHDVCVCFGHAPTTSYLHLGTNLICGSFPSTVTGLSGLRSVRECGALFVAGCVWCVLHLHSTKNVPTFRCDRFSALYARSLWLSNNLMNGSFPSVIGGLSSLECVSPAWLCAYWECMYGREGLLGSGCCEPPGVCTPRPVHCRAFSHGAVPGCLVGLRSGWQTFAGSQQCFRWDVPKHGGWTVNASVSTAVTVSGKGNVLCRSVRFPQLLSWACCTVAFARYCL